MPADAGIPSPRVAVPPSGDSAESWRRLACDAPHVAVTQDKEGNILNIGRRAVDALITYDDDPVDEE